MASSFTSLYRSGECAYLGKGFASKSHNLSLISGTYLVERTDPTVVLWPEHMPESMVL